MSGPFDIVRQFEAEVAAYTGAPFCVAVSSCTMALLLACAWQREAVNREAERRGSGMMPLPPEVRIPRRTYVSVPMSVMHAGYRVSFTDDLWSGAYRLFPLPVWDSARWFTADLWRTLQGFVCLSFHASKTLGISQGGAILHDSPEADAWLRRARFDGRTEGVDPKDDHFDMIGYHCYLSPDIAAGLLLKLHSLPRHNAPLPNSDYPDLSLCEAFR